MKRKIAGIILAGGKGTRLNSKDVNKVVYPFCGKPMIQYGVDLFEKMCDQIVVVVGAFAQSVKDVLADRTVSYASQEEQLGTGHAVKVGLASLREPKPDLVLVGMGDHMMYYSQKTLQNLIDLHTKEQAVVSFISTTYEKQQELAWGHIERDAVGKVVDIIEHKDADDEQKKIKEINAGLYCFDYNFLSTHIESIIKSTVTSEYYLTDIIHIAFKDKLPVVALQVPFEEVGIGVNRIEELSESEDFYKKIH